MATIRYDPAREVTVAYLETVRAWVEAHGEVLVICRFLCGAGRKDFFLVDSFDEFQRLVDAVPRGTDIIVVRGQHLPLRGTVTPDFMKQAMERVPDGEEYMVVCTSEAEGSRGFGFDGDSHVSMRSDLEVLLGEPVAFGASPDFMGPDNEGMISASKGGIDGPR